MKRLVAYTSVSHMGFVLLGIFAWNTLALQGVVLQLVCHALSTGALFILVGGLQDRIHTRDMGKMGGLWTIAPRMGGTAMFFALASLGLPGLGNFVAEFLILVGTWQVAKWAAVLGAVGLVFATVYALWMMQRAFQGEETHGWTLRRPGAARDGDVRRHDRGARGHRLLPAAADHDGAADGDRRAADHGRQQPDGRPAGGERRAGSRRTPAPRRLTPAAAAADGATVATARADDRRRPPHPARR